MRKFGINYKNKLRLSTKLGLWSRFGKVLVLGIGIVQQFLYSIELSCTPWYSPSLQTWQWRPWCCPSSKPGNTLLTRIRVGKSSLNQHKFTIGLSDSTEYLCHFKTESPEHFFLDCFLYSPERQSLISLIEHYVPNINRLNKTQKTKVNIDDSELFQTNVTSTLAVGCPINTYIALNLCAEQELLCIYISEKIKNK
jgi:hypothetical protein